MFSFYLSMIIKIPNISYKFNYINCDKVTNKIPNAKQNYSVFGVSRAVVKTPMSQTQVITPLVKYTLPQQRKIELSKFNLNKGFFNKFLNCPETQYQQTLKLLTNNVFHKYVEPVSKLEGRQWQQAYNLSKKNVGDEYLEKLATLEENQYNRAIYLADKGIDTKYLYEFAQQDDKNYNQALEFLKEGYPQELAYCLAELPQKKRDEFLDMYKNGCDLSMAFSLVQLDEHQVEKYSKAQQIGYSMEDSIAYASISDDNLDKLKPLTDLKMSISNILEIKNIDDEKIKEAERLYKEGVLEEYIPCIIQLNGENEEYNRRIQKGYSPTSAYAISTIEDKCEKESINKILAQHSEIQELFKDNYDVQLINLQNSNKKILLLEKEIKNQDGTRIILTKLFSSDGEKTSNRYELYPDETCSSSIKKQGCMFRNSKSKNNKMDIEEYLQDAKTGVVIGVKTTCESDLLQGCFESTYYDIKTLEDNTEKDIEDIKDGIPISQVVKNADGSIVFTESFNYNGLNTTRFYEEKKDEEGKIIHSRYSYIISDKEKNNLMETSQSFCKNPDGTVTNIINGIEYNLTYDDKEKSVTISDGEREKFLSFKNILPFFAQDKMWETVKTLDTDTLLTINNNIIQWNYCLNKNSIANHKAKLLSSDVYQDTILHETGHIKDFINDYLCDDKTLVEKYNKEMEKFEKSIPYREQTYIEYFSRRADRLEVEGIAELLAEANMLLSTYGMKDKSINKRGMFLVRYFPETIVRCAELLGRTSKESLLLN